VMRKSRVDRRILRCIERGGSIGVASNWVHLSDATCGVPSSLRYAYLGEAPNQVKFLAVPFLLCAKHGRE